MASNIGNPAGAVLVADAAAPRIVTGVAGAQTISGGVFCFTSGATAVVSSGLNSYVNTDIKFVGNASGTQFNGVCLQSAGSNTPVAVATRGVFILLCAGSVFAGKKVTADGVNGVLNLGSFAVPVDAEDAAAAGRGIGRALTEGASGGYAIIDINP